MPPLIANAPEKVKEAIAGFALALVPAGSFIVSFVDAIERGLRICSLLLAVAIAAVTLYNLLRKKP